MINHSSKLAAAYPTKPLSECLQSVNVPAKIPKKAFLDTGKFPIVSQESDFINGYWNDEADAIQVDKPIVVFGDHTQVLKLIDFDFVVGADGVKLLKPKEFLDAAFLRYFLEANPVPSLGYARHYRHISGMPVPLMLLEEQKRIVAVLDQAFAALDRARALAEANLADAGDLFKVKLDATFRSAGKNKIRVDELFRVGSSKRVLKSEWKDSGVPFYRGREVTRLALDGKVANELFISEGHYAELAAKTGVPEPGDIVITAIGTIGNAYVVGKDDRFYFKDASVLWMHRTSEISSDFVKFWIRSASFHDQLERGNGATVDTLTIGKLQGLLMPELSAKEQERVVEELTAFEKGIGCLSSSYERKLADLATLRQSLLQKAFAGELT